MQPIEADDKVVWLYGPGEPTDLDLTPYAGQYVAFTLDRTRVVLAAATIEEFLHRLQELAERGESVLIGGFVPLESLPLIGNGLQSL